MDIDLNEVFDKGGILNRTLDEYEFRPGQKKMALKVKKALESDQYLLIEAGTSEIGILNAG